MRPFEINTTAYDEENFVILTDLNEIQIKKVIEPIVKFYYYNEPKLISI
jgi:hypothetical protein